VVTKLTVNGLLELLFIVRSIPPHISHFNDYVLLYYFNIAPFIAKSLHRIKDTIENGEAVSKNLIINIENGIFCHL